MKGVEDLLDQASAGSIIHLKRAEQNKEVMQRVARIVPFKPVEEVRTKARSGGFSKKSVALPSRHALQAARSRTARSSSTPRLMFVALTAVPTESAAGQAAR